MIRQRREHLAKAKAISDIVGNYVGPTTDNIKPKGPNVGQRLLTLFGEQDSATVDVFYVVNDSNSVVVLRDGWERTKDTTEFPEVQRGQALFPEAEVHATYIEERFLQKGIFPGVSELLAK